MRDDGTVNDDLVLAAVDIVADPSAPKGLVQTIRENREWIIGPDGIFVEAAMTNLVKSTDKKFTDSSAAETMSNFLKEIDLKIKLKRIL
jgi:hypothetical protein